MRVRSRQLAGVLLLLVVLAGTALWVSAGRPMPASPAVDVAVEPVVVPPTRAAQLAQRIADESVNGRAPRRVDFDGRSVGVTQRGATARACLPDAPQCAAVNLGTGRVQLYTPAEADR